MSQPTKQEIQKMITDLQEIKPRLRRFSAFGDDNWKDVDAQIRVLEKDMDQDEIDDRWDYDLGTRLAAEEALRWVNGEPLEGEGLLENLQGLVIE